MKRLDRRGMLRLTGLASAMGIGATAARASGQYAAAPSAADPMRHAGHLAGPVGRTTLDIFNPTTFLRAWNFSDRPADERNRLYKETRRPDGTLLREYQIVAVDRELEIAPGVFFPAWTFNGQVP